jgi:hypothetical protein
MGGRFKYRPLIVLEGSEVSLVMILVVMPVMMEHKLKRSPAPPY